MRIRYRCFYPRVKCNFGKSEIEWHCRNAPPIVIHRSQPLGRASASRGGL